MLAVRNGTLDKTPVLFEDAACCCVVMASGGYPGSYKKGLPIFGLELAEKQGCTVYHAGTARDKDGLLVTNGGRVLGVTAIGKTLAQAVQTAYKGVNQIGFYGQTYRNDIAKKDEQSRLAGTQTKKDAQPVTCSHFDWS